MSVYGNGNLAPRALEITTKVVNKIKYLDGAVSITVRVKTWEGGEPYYRDVEVFIGYDDKATATVEEIDIV